MDLSLTTRPHNAAENPRTAKIADVDRDSAPAWTAKEIGQVSIRHVSRGKDLVGLKPDLQRFSAVAPA